MYLLLKCRVEAFHKPHLFRPPARIDVFTTVRAAHEMGHLGARPNVLDELASVGLGELLHLGSHVEVGNTRQAEGCSCEDWESMGFHALLVFLSLKLG